MNDLKQAYHTLGLPENASREEVEKVFENELIKSRGRRSTDKSKDGAGNEFDLIIKAYKQIVQYEDKLILEHKSRERYQKWGRFAGKAEKVDDFFRLYKAHVIVGALALIAIIVGINAFIDHREEQKRLAALPPIDLSVLYMGNFGTSDGNDETDQLAEAMTAQFPEFKRIEVKMNYMPPQTEGINTSDIAYQQKAMAVLATEKPDLYILDKPSFEWLSKGGALLPIDEEIEDVLQTLLTPDSALVERSDEDTTDRIYGVDVTNSSLANELPLHKNAMILTLRSNSKNIDNATLFIQRYLEGTQ